jgi:uncharacterized protein YggT (Ycf19 family)
MTESTIQRTTVSSQQVEPVAKGEAPQQAFNKKKTILKSNQILWYILGIIEVLLVFRLFLKMLAANPNAGFTRFIYGITDALTAPFRGILGTSVSNGSSLEGATIIAGIVYLCLAWGLTYLFNLFFPIQHTDVEGE